MVRLAGAPNGTKYVTRRASTLARDVTVIVCLLTAVVAWRYAPDPATLLLLSLLFLPELVCVYGLVALVSSALFSAEPAFTVEPVEEADRERER